MPIIAPAAPQPDPTAADTTTLIDTGVLPTQPEPTPEPLPPTAE